MKIKIREDKEATFWLEQDDEDDPILLRAEQGHRIVTLLEIRGDKIIKVWGETGLKWDLSSLENEEVEKDLDD